MAYNEIIDTLRSISHLVGTPGASDTFILVNNTPIWGVLTFQEPEFTYSHEVIYSKHSKEPIAIEMKDRELPTGSMQIAHNDYNALKQLLPFFNSGLDYLSSITQTTEGKFISIGRYVGNITSQAEELIFRQTGKLRVIPSESIRYYSDVLIIGEAAEEMNKDLNLYVYTLELLFTKKPTILEIGVST